MRIEVGNRIITVLTELEETHRIVGTSPNDKVSANRIKNRNIGSTVAVVIARRKRVFAHQTELNWKSRIIGAAVDKESVSA